MRTISPGTHNDPADAKAQTQQAQTQQAQTQQAQVQQALIQEARRRRRRRYLVNGLTLAVSVALGAAVTLAVVRPDGGRRPTALPHGGQVPRAGVSPAMPPFFVDTAGSALALLEVRASSDGKLVSTDHAIPPMSYYGMAATGSSSFVISEQASAGCSAQIYRVRLNRRGHPSRPSPVGPPLPGIVQSLAASADGTVIAAALDSCGASPATGYIRVFNTRTGGSTQWSGLDGANPGSVDLDGWMSMSANGKLLAFNAMAPGAHETSAGPQVRVLSTSAPAGTVDGRSRIVLHKAFLTNGSEQIALTPSGGDFYLCTLDGHGRGFSVARYQTSTGAFLGTVARLHMMSVVPVCAMALSPSGGYLLVTAGTAVAPGNRPQITNAIRIDLATGAQTAMRFEIASGYTTFAPGIGGIAW
jgi:hypothetical protein